LIAPSITPAAEKIPSPGDEWRYGNRGQADNEEDEYQHQEAHDQWVIGNAEHLEKGAKKCFVVTPLSPTVWAALSANPGALLL